MCGELQHYLYVVGNDNKFRKITRMVVTFVRRLWKMRNQAIKNIMTQVDNYQDQMFSSFIIGSYIAIFSGTRNFLFLRRVIKTSLHCKFQRVNDSHITYCNISWQCDLIY